MFYNVKEFTLNLEDAEMDCISFGKGKKTLVMIQGLNTQGIKGAGLALAYMYRIFAKEYTVYFFDRKNNVKKGVTVRELAKDLASGMDALGLTNADVIGVSQGGMIGQYLAIDRPDLVRKLVLVVTLSKNNDTVKEVVGNWIAWTRANDIKSLVLDMAKKMYSDKYLKNYEPFLPLLTLVQKPNDKQRFCILAKSCLTCDIYEQLDKINCPVFVIGAKQDKIVTGEASIEIAEKIGCQVYMYENLGHAAYEEANNFNKLIYNFLI